MWSSPTTAAFGRGDGILHRGELARRRGGGWHVWQETGPRQKGERKGRRGKRFGRAWSQNQLYLPMVLAEQLEAARLSAPRGGSALTAVGVVSHLVQQGRGNDRGPGGREIAC